ncbi:hypothetical protein ACQPXM_28855 [Kribbella sp. CA-253562]|uniref:hypothetical protein n=1 Tax=Kribbella sp. CA-253562 TaxID=3239942 RepID=UPI003D89B33F
MSTTLTATRTTTAKPWRLTGKARKLTLVLHLASVGSWIGLDVAMAVLVFTAMGSDDPGTKSLSFPALELVTIWPMTISGLTCLVTGVLLAYGSNYGLTKYWWVVVKLGLNLLLSTLVLIALRPGVEEMADQARQPGAVLKATDLIFPPIVSPTLLMVAVVLSVFKPWGRLRRKN